jgi:hypothetical protein
MLQQGSRGAYCALVGIMVAVCGLAIADDKQSGTRGRKESGPGKASGVITKVEPIGGDLDSTTRQEGARNKGKARKHAWRMTVNTDVVWRDFVRDQATDPAKAARTGTAKAAAKGRESVATEGHPKDNQVLVTVGLDPQTEITTRYRSSTDAIGEGSATPEGAGEAEAATDNASGRAASRKAARPGSRRQALKAGKMDPGELKPGLWVEVEFRHNDKQNRARRVLVMRPVGGPDTSPEKEKPSTTPGSDSGR